MASTNLTLFAATLLLFCTFLTTESKEYATKLSPEKLGLRPEKQKLTHFHFYLYEKLSGSDANAVKVAQAPTSSQPATLFGNVVVQDEPMLVGPDKNSKLIGRAQGIAASASQEEFALLVARNFAFTEGSYNGSTVTVLGRHPANDKLSELPVVGGTGAFRFARGYVQLSTYELDISGGVSILEYDMYVIHY